jgi:hypothetical protein
MKKAFCENGIEGEDVDGRDDDTVDEEEDTIEDTIDEVDEVEVEDAKEGAFFEKENFAFGKISFFASESAVSKVSIA